MKLTKLSFLLLLTFSALTKAALPSGPISSLTVTHPQYGSVIRVAAGDSDGGSGGPGGGASNSGSSDAENNGDMSGGSQDGDAGSGDPGSTEGGAGQGDGDGSNTGGMG
jgi:hypothetical protein